MNISLNGQRIAELEQRNHDLMIERDKLNEEVRMLRVELSHVELFGDHK